MSMTMLQDGTSRTQSGLWSVWAKTSILTARDKFVSRPSNNEVGSHCIFLVDIKLALGNNPHLFTVFPWKPHVAYVIRL